MSRHFTSPWTVEKIAGGFKVIDANGQALAYVCSETKDAANIAGVFTEDEARRRIIGSFAASSSVAEAYCRQLMEVLGIQEKEWPDERREEKG